MKTTTFALLTSLSVSAGAVLSNRNPLPSPEGSGVTLNLAQPHSGPIRLIHQHLSPSNPAAAAAAANSKRQSSSTASSVQGGGVLSSSPEKKISHVSTTFRVPSAKVPTVGPTANNPVGVYASSFWVGIDGVALPPPTNSTGNGSSCNPAAAALRLGVDIFYDGTFGGEQTPFAWFQYLPRSAAGFGNFTVAPGDVVRLSATTSSSSSSSSSAGGGVGGTVTIENFGPDGNISPTVGKKTAAAAKKALQVASYTFSEAADGELPALCQTQAAMVVEDFPLAGMPEFPIALANFTSVEFGDVRIQAGDGEKLSLLGRSGKAKGRAINIVQPPQGGRLTDCHIIGRGYSRDNSGVVACERVVEAL